MQKNQGLVRTTVFLLKIATTAVSILDRKFGFTVLSEPIITTK